MVLSQNILFFDLNYGEFASVTGTNLFTETALYGYDNRADVTVDFSSMTGSYIYDFGASQYYELNRILLNNHNLKDFNFLVNTGSTWYTLTGYTNQTLSSHYFEFSNTLAYDVQVEFTSTQNSQVAYFGEFIVTKEKFQLNYNPNTYRPAMEPVGPVKRTLNGRTIFNEREDVFRATIGWSMLQGDPNTLTNTDLQNVTELFRKRTTFLFWPNANNEFPNIYTWRKQDVFKCKCLVPINYEFLKPTTYLIKAQFQIEEVY